MHVYYPGLSLSLSLDMKWRWSPGGAEREFFIDNLLFRIHLIIKMISADRPCAMGV